MHPLAQILGICERESASNYACFNFCLCKDIMHAGNDNLIGPTSFLLSSCGVDIPPIPPTSPPHKQLLKELGVGGVPSASLSIATAHPPCKQMLASVVGVIVVVVVVLLSVVYWCHVCCVVHRR